MRTNPFYDAWLFLIGQTSDHENSGVGSLLVALFLRSSWRQHLDRAAELAGGPGAAHKAHLATWFMRVMIGAMWFQGSLWKLPLPVSGGFEVLDRGRSRENAAFEFHKWIANNVFVPLLPVINPLVFLTELSLAVAFILGFLVRPLGVIGMLFVAHLWLGLYLHPAEWPWLYIFLIFVQGFFVLNNAGKSLGLDALLARAPVGPFAGNGVMARLYRRVV